MYRYRMLAYYEDKVTETRVAQAMVVLAERDDAAIGAAKAEAATNALSGRIPSVRVVEKRAVVPEVAFCGDPYIPMHWLGPKPAATADSTPSVVRR